MSDQIEPTQKTSVDFVASKFAEVKTFDPGLGAYEFPDLQAVIQFTDVMSRAAEFLPPLLRGKPAMCLAVVMRAKHWKMDPFALAAEVYQAKDGGPIGYQAKVFGAALQSCAGITLQFRYDGEFKIENRAAESAKGNTVSRRTAVGNRRCIAFATIDGILLEYATPTLDEITVKNSPSWHNDPDQQLSYYATRGWARRYRPGVIMGAYSNEEVEVMRDVTPAEKPKSAFAAIATAARAETAQADAQTIEGTAETVERDIEAFAAEAAENGAPGSEAFDAGRDAFVAGEPLSASPNEPDTQEAADWFFGYLGARRAAE